MQLPPRPQPAVQFHPVPTSQLHAPSSHATTSELAHTPETVLSMSGAEQLSKVPPLLISASRDSLSSAPRSRADDSPSSTSRSRVSNTSHSQPPSPVMHPLHVDAAAPSAQPATFASSHNASSLPTTLSASPPSSLPPLSTNRDRLLFVWRILDAYIIFIRPLVFPLLAWCIGALNLSLLFPVLLALAWYYAAKNGHVFPRPPPSAQQLQAVLDKKAAEELLNPSSPSDAVDAAASAAPVESSGPVSFQLDDRNIESGVGSATMLGLPAMLSGLTVQYPVWVFYPDVQRVKWMNDMLDHLWPYAKAAVKAEAERLAAPYLAQLSPYVVLAELDLGPDAPFVGGIKTFDTKSSDSVMMDVDLCISIEPRIRVEARYKGLVLPVSVIAVTATLTARVTLAELVGKFPCFRRLSVALSEKPQIQTVVDVLGVNVFDIPIVGSWAQHLIESVAMNLFGWPKELSIPIMVETAEEAAKRSRLEPKGLLHVFLMSANQLRNVDVGLLGKSDPYCRLRVAKQEQRSAVINDNLSPVWSQDFEFIVYEPEKEVLQIEVLDQDRVNVPNPLNSKRLGDVDFPIASLIASPFQDVTLPLNNTTKGNIRFQVEWRPFKPSKGGGSKRHHSSSKAASDGDGGSDSVLFVSSLRAVDLPVDTCQLKMMLSNTKKKTTLIPVQGRSFEWLEGFSFPVRNADVDLLTVQLRYADHLGKLTGFATRTATLGMAKVNTKPSTLAELTIDMREVARTGHLQDDFTVPLPPGMKSIGRPKLHMSLMLRELQASKGQKERSMAAARSAVPGQLSVTLVRASHLISDYKGKTSDPYAVITVGSHHVKSAVRKKTTEPEWNETHTFAVSDLLRDDLDLDLRDWSHMGMVPGVGSVMSGFMHKVTQTNDHLGDAHIPLRMLYAQLRDGQRVERELPLNHTTKGTITIVLQFTPAAGVELPPAAMISQSSMPDLLRIGSLSSTGSSGSDGLLSRQASTSTLGHVSEAGEPHVIAGHHTDATAVTPVLSAPLEHATMGIAASLKTGEQLQRIQEQSESTRDLHILTSTSSSTATPMLTSTTASAVVSAAPSGTNTPNRPLVLHPSVDMTNTPPSELSAMSPSHSRQSSAAGVMLDSDSIHADPRTLEGYLVLTVHHALQLPPQHRDHTVSAYVKLSLGRAKVHTAVVTAVEPSWEAQVRLPLHTAEAVHPQSTVLKVRVKRYKRGSLFGNEVVGDADLPLSQLIDAKVGDGGFHIGNIRLDHGTVTLLDPKSSQQQGSLVLSAHFERAQQPQPLATPHGGGDVGAGAEHKGGFLGA